MTNPTERAAIAEAIAALEPFEEFAELWEGKPDLHPASMYDADGGRDLMIIDFRRARTALASLRALAPAPADQSDAGRDGVIEENVAWLERYQKLIDGWMQVAINKQRNATIARIDELNKRRALASASSESERNGTIEKCAAIAKAEMDRLQALQPLPSDDPMDTDNLRLRIVARNIYDAIRALASAPSETKFRCNCPHEVRGGCLEPGCPHGNVPSEAPKPPGQEPGGEDTGHV